MITIKFSITNIDNSCLTNFQPGFIFDDVCSNQNEFLFGDNLHPNTVIYQLIAEEALEVLPQQESKIVPEPNIQEVRSRDVSRQNYQFTGGLNPPVTEDR